MEVKSYKPEDYGAAADGIMDDGRAVSQAVAAAVAAAKADTAQRFWHTVTLRKDGVYRIERVPEENVDRSLFSLVDCRNVAICGDNTKLLMKAPVKVASVIRCEHVKINGLVIDFSPKPYVLGNVTKVDCDACAVDFDVRGELGFDGDHFEAPDPFFAFPNTDKMRYHYFITQYIRLDGQKHYRATIKPEFRDRVEKVRVGDEWILPFVGASHFGGGNFLFTRNADFEMCDCTILSLPEFGFDIRNNLGKGRFQNIRMIPDEQYGVKLVSWRDGFHVKDNLDQIVWENCYFGPLGDDAFNLSCVQLDIQSIEADSVTMHLLPAEAGKTRELLPGDDYVAYDVETGAYFGEGRLKEVYDSDHDVFFKLDRPLPGMKPGMQISIYRYADQGYVIKDCYIEGTVRARGSGTFLRDTFNVFWVRVENEFFVEGPVPKDILFQDCSFTTPYENKDEEIFHVGTLGKGGRGDCAYKCKNIVLENCRFLKGRPHADEGNELIIK